ncbi:MAG: substrate-binding domain-containing protein [Eubacteriales bacterium]|nr:substrate-binding domain-containing protein [Eubacteriales bacterium]
MKKSKALILCLSAVLAVSMLAGCGSSGSSSSSSTKKSSSKSSTEEGTLFTEYKAKMEKLLDPLPEKNKTKSIGLIVSPTSNSYWATLVEGAKDCAKDYGVNLDVTQTQSDTDFSGQLDILNTMVSKNEEAVAFSPQSGTNLIQGIVNANKNNVKTVLNGTALDEDALKQAGGHIDGATVVDCYHQGEVNAAFVAKKNKNKGKVAIIGGSEGATQSDDRVSGAKDTYKKKGMEVVAVQNCDFDAQKAYETVKNIATAHPDLVGITCCNDDMALGAVRALKELDLNDQVVVCGVDFTDAAKESIKNGELDGTIAQSPYLNGYACILMTLKVAQGQDVGNMGDIVPATVVSKSNLSKMKGWK